jgi:hypothetical protein
VVGSKDVADGAREMELNMFLISRRSIAWEGGRLAWRGREM